MLKKDILKMLEEFENEHDLSIKFYRPKQELGYSASVALKKIDELEKRIEDIEDEWM